MIHEIAQLRACLGRQLARLAAAGIDATVKVGAASLEPDAQTVCVFVLPAGASWIGAKVTLAAPIDPATFDDGAWTRAVLHSESSLIH